MSAALFAIILAAIVLLAWVGGFCIGLSGAVSSSQRLIAKRWSPPHVSQGD